MIPRIEFLSCVGNGARTCCIWKKGVTVSAKGDSDIAVKIYTENVKTNDLIFYGSSQILIGEKGITLGNEIAASTSHIDWAEGPVIIDVYGNGAQNESTVIIFVLKK
jgi:hypothetical protein